MSAIAGVAKVRRVADDSKTVVRRTALMQTLDRANTWLKESYSLSIVNPFLLPRCD